MSQTQTSNEAENEIKEDLYMLYLELKEELTSKNIEMSKEQISEAANATNVNIMNIESLNNEKIGWGIKREENHKCHSICGKARY